MARARSVGGGSNEDQKLKERLTAGRGKKSINKNKLYGTKNRSGKKRAGQGRTALRRKKR